MYKLKIDEQLKSNTGALNIKITEFVQMITTIDNRKESTTIT